MRGLIAALLLALLPVTAWAQALPGLYSVTGVAEDDVLNVRAAPDAQSPIVATLAPGTTGIEVVRLSENGWGLVSTGEGNGWASMHFLAAEPAEPGTVPRPMRCGGTEPFWGLDLGWGGDEFQMAGEDRVYLTLTSEVSQAAGFASIFDDGETTRVLTVSRATCSDGMSDREFGFAATLLTRAAGGDSLLFGCCTLDLR